MNKQISLFILIFFSLLISCGNEQQSASNVSKLSVDFVWKGMESCGKDNPKFDIKGIPPNTKFIKIDMKDKGYHYDNKSAQISFDGYGDIIGKKFEDRMQFFAESSSNLQQAGCCQEQPIIIDRAEYL